MSNYLLFCSFSQNLARLSSGFILYKLFSGDCLALISHLKTTFSNKIFRYLKNVFLRADLRKVNFLCTVMTFFRDPCAFPHIKTLLKASDPIFVKNPT